MKIALKNRVVWEIGGEITVFDLRVEENNFWFKLLGGSEIEVKKIRIPLLHHKLFLTYDLTWQETSECHLLKSNGLFLNQLPKQTIRFIHQLSIGASLRDLAITQHNNVVGIFDSWKAMCNGDDSSTLH